jgi:multiple sugar transport system permease protein
VKGNAARSGGGWRRRGSALRLFVSTSLRLYVSSSLLCFTTVFAVQSIRMAPDQRPNWHGYLFVAPASIYLAVFSLLPILCAGWMALHRWHLLRVDRPFVGLDNFANLARDPFFRNAVWNTLCFVALGVPVSVGAALLVALLVAQPLRGVALFRTIIYIPAVCSQVAIAMVWTWILMPTNGLINGTLGILNQLLSAILNLAGTIGLPLPAAPAFPTDTAFLEHGGLAMAALVAMFAWFGLGPRMIIFVAGIQSIPDSLYEAAALDGASAWRRARHVTLPLLAPTTLFVLVTTTIAAFQIFTPVYILTRGGPERRTDVVLYHIFTEAWQKLEFGMASAMSYVLLAMILAVSLLQLRFFRADTGVDAT